MALHQVYKGYSKITGLDVAVKLISIRRLDRKAQANLESEISILRRTRHENIVRLLDVQVRQAAERAAGGRRCVVCAGAVALRYY